MLFLFGLGTPVVELAGFAELGDGVLVYLEVTERCCVVGLLRGGTACKVERVRWAKEEDTLYIGEIEGFVCPSCGWTGVRISSMANELLE